MTNAGLLSDLKKFFGVGINSPSSIAYKLIPSNTNIKTANAGLEVASATSTNPPVGIVTALQKTFKLLLTYPTEIHNIPKHAIRLKVSVRENITAALTGGDQYRINADVLKNGTSILAAKQNGATRTTPTAVGNNVITHALQFDVPDDAFKEGDTYEVLVEVEVTAINRGTGSITYTLNYDPNTANNELFVEVDI